MIHLLLYFVFLVVDCFRLLRYLRYLRFDLDAPHFNTLAIVKVVLRLMFLNFGCLNLIERFLRFVFNEWVRGVVAFLAFRRINKSSIDNRLHGRRKKIRLSLWPFGDRLKTIVIFVGIIDLFLNNLQQPLVKVEKSSYLILMLSVQFFLFLDFL